MLSRAFRYRILNIANSSDLHAIIKSFEIEVPRREIKSPYWNLDTVLKALCQEPFGPFG